MLLVLRSLWEVQTVETTGTSSGLGTATGVGAAIFASVGTAAGTAAVLGESATIGVQAVEGSATGSSTVLGVGEAVITGEVVPPEEIGGGGAGGIGAISPHYIERGKALKAPKKARKAKPEVSKPKPVEAEKKPPKAKPTPKAKVVKPKSTPEAALPKIEIPTITARKGKAKRLVHVFPEPAPAVVIQAVGTAVGTSEVIGQSGFSQIVEASFGLPDEITEEEFVFLALAA